MAASKTYSVEMQLKFKAADSKEWSDALEEAGAELQNWGKQAMRSGALIGAGLGGLAKLAADSEQGFAEVSTLLSGAAEEALPSLIAGIEQLETVMPHTRETLTKALYQILSASVPPAEALEFLGQTGKLATAGLADVNEVADVGTSIMNAYQLPIEELGTIYDQLFATVKYGKTTLPELAGALGRLIPIAAAGNFDFSEMAGAMAELTKQGQNTRIAVTGLRATLSAMIKPTDEAYQMLRQLGGQAYEDAVAAGDFNGAIQVLAASAPELKEMAEAFPNIRALSAVAALINNADDLAEVTANVANSAGSMEEAYQKMSGTATSQMTRMRNELQAMGIELGKGVIPIVHELAQRLRPLAQGLIDFVRQNPELISMVAKLAALVAGFKLLGGGIAYVAGGFLKFAGKFTGFISGAGSAVGTLVTKFGALATKITGLSISGPMAFGILGVAIAGVIGIVGALIESLDDSQVTSEELIQGAEALEGFHQRVVERMREQNAELDEALTHIQELKAETMEDTAANLQLELDQAAFEKSSDEMREALIEAFSDARRYSDELWTGGADIALYQREASRIAEVLSSAIAGGDYETALATIYEQFDKYGEEFRNLFVANDEFKPFMDQLNQMLDKQESITAEMERQARIAVLQMAGVEGYNEVLSSTAELTGGLATASAEELTSIEDKIAARVAELKSMQGQVYVTGIQLEYEYRIIKALAARGDARQEFYEARAEEVYKELEAAAAMYGDLRGAISAAEGELDAIQAGEYTGSTEDDRGLTEDGGGGGGGDGGAGESPGRSVTTGGAAGADRVYIFNLDGTTFQYGNAASPGEAFDRFLEDVAVGRA